MSSSTENLGLFKWDTSNSEDLSSSFDIDKTLNNNWDKIDVLGNLIYANSGAHNAIYRGKDITDLFYDGTLSKQIAAGTFDDIFPGDYIIGSSSGITYLVGELNYRYMCGDTKCTTQHILMFPFGIMGTAQMNSSNTTEGAYVGSEMYTTTLADYKTIIQEDFGTDHILTHRQYLSNTVTSGYESAGTWVDSDIELMNERMVYGNMPYTNVVNGTNVPQNRTIDKTQLAVFRHRPDLILAGGSKTASSFTTTSRANWWLRDVVSSLAFAYVGNSGLDVTLGASNSFGIRPAFLIY